MRLAVRLTPKAAADRILGIAPTAEGGAVLKVGVTAAPEDGKANARLVALLAKSFRVAKSDIALIQGQTQRNKILFLKGEADDLRRRLDTLARPT